MGETLGKFWDFYLELAKYMWTAYFEEPSFLFGVIADNPGSSWFELLFALFLVATAATIAAALIASAIVARSKSYHIASAGRAGGQAGVRGREAGRKTVAGTVS